MEEYLKLVPSNASLVGAYSSFSTSFVLFKTAYNQIIPKQLQDFVLSKLRHYFSLHKPSYGQFIIEDLWCGFGRNELYDASQSYLSTKIGPENRQIKVGKLEKHKNVSAAIAEGSKLVDTFQGIPITWSYVEQDRQRGSKTEKADALIRPLIPSSTTKCSTYYQITFDNKYREKVESDYLNHVLSIYKSLKLEERVLKLYRRNDNYEGGGWKSIEFEHPFTFDTLAMDPELKSSIINDLDRFLTRKEFYKRVGKSWKRGYLLYGPPGTGKSSLIAAMANYLKFDIYDLELTGIHSDAELRKVLLSITNRSILVVEDIDCNSEVHDRSKLAIDEEKLLPRKYAKPFTLATLLNCIDGLWSCTGEARIVVFTTNHKELLDPALVRPGRMDMHIHMSYCSPKGFRVLACNYLGIHEHKLYQEIDGLVKCAKVTPASLSEELMKSDDPDVALGEVVNFLKRKRMEDQEDEFKVENKIQRTA